MATKSSNLPRFKDGWTAKDGSTKQGFWQFRHEGKYVSLTKYGSPNTNKPLKETRQAAIQARDNFLKLEAQPEQGSLLVWQVLQPYIEKHLGVTRTSRLLAY